MVDVSAVADRLFRRKRKPQLSAWVPATGKWVLTTVHAASPCDRCRFSLRPLELGICDGNRLRHAYECKAVPPARGDR